MPAYALRGRRPGRLRQLMQHRLFRDPGISYVFAAGYGLAGISYFKDPAIAQRTVVGEAFAPYDAIWNGLYILAAVLIVIRLIIGGRHWEGTGLVVLTGGLVVASIVGIGVGLVVVGLWQHSTANTVEVVQRNSRCNGGDLAACRVVAENLRRACTPRILSRVPARRQARERRRCGLARAALRSTSRTAPGRSSSSASPTPSTRSPAPSGRTLPAPRSPPTRPKQSRPSSPDTSPPATAPATSTTPAAPSAPARPVPLIDLPDVLPCVVQLQPVLSC